jgi:hypothetical protein
VARKRRRQSCSAQLADVTEKLDVSRRRRFIFSGCASCESASGSSSATAARCSSGEQEQNRELRRRAGARGCFACEAAARCRLDRRYRLR